MRGVVEMRVQWVKGISALALCLIGLALDPAMIAEGKEPTAFWQQFPASAMAILIILSSCHVPTSRFMFGPMPVPGSPFESLCPPARRVWWAR